MSEIKKEGNQFVGYEYKDILVRSDRASMYLDGYENFGWIADERTPPRQEHGLIHLKFKRDRKLVNRAELTRLQRHFEACMEELELLERSRRKAGIPAALTIGIIGTAFMAGSTFAVTHEPPLIGLCILLAIPGFLGWILPYFVNKQLIHRKIQQTATLISGKYDEIYETCEKGNHLLF